MTEINIRSATENDIEKKEGGWDVFEEGQDKLFFTGFCQTIEGFIKLPFVILLFCFTIVTGVISRVTLHIMIWHLHPPTINSTSRSATMNYQLTYKTDMCPEHSLYECYQETQYLGENWFWALFIAMILPCIFSIFSSLRSFCSKVSSETQNETTQVGYDSRGDQSRPNNAYQTNSVDGKDTRQGNVITLIKYILLHILPEVIDAVAVCIMIFEVLPQYDPATASVIYLVIGTPCFFLDFIDICKFSRCNNLGNKTNGVSTTTTNQSEKVNSVNSVSNLYKGVAHGSQQHTGNTENYGDADDDQNLFKTAAKYLQDISSKYSHRINLGLVITGIISRIIGIVFISIYNFNTLNLVICFLIGFRYIKNFTKKLSQSTHDSQKIEDKRRITALLTNIIKLVIYFVGLIVQVTLKCSSPSSACANAMFGKGEANYSTEFDIIEFGEDPFCSNHMPFVIALINIISSLLFFKCARTACAIQAQIFSFSFPTITLIPVVTTVCLIQLLRNPEALHFGSCNVMFDYWSIGTGSFMSSWEIILAFVFLIISFACLCRYSLICNGLKQGKTERIFCLPFYCGVFTDFGTLLNRRRFDNEKTPKEENDSVAADKIKLYACATMWHEEQYEMVQLLISIFKLDRHIFDINDYLEKVKIKDQSKDLNSMKKNVKKKYDLEVHIFFDDAFETPTEKSDSKQKSKVSGKGFDKKQLNVNDYVKTLFKSIEEGKRRLYDQRIGIEEIESFVTPFGGRIEFRLPFWTKCVIHLKDKTKIRARKRWSQVMYMYYLLSFDCGFDPRINNYEKGKVDNTFILALDGDVDFKPEAVDQLIQRMTKNSNVGAVCGRIHPIGSGPIVWYQKFEYAVSHWLQKATEHVTGCVLCSPGCFSLFRASALIDKNVAKSYTKNPSEARHHVQYDQGEDRWLCTLLLKRGYRVDYVAEADAFTYAPENFYDFWKQRRRWSPSTMANILEILTDNAQLRRENQDISLLYIIYQIILFVSSILTPGTIFMLVVGAVLIGFPDMSPMLLTFGAVLSAIYAILMLIVILGLLKTSIDQGFCSSTTIILVFVAIVFIISALAHPKEVSCILHGLLFFIAVPSVSMLMFLYSVANLNNVNWGTREKPKDKKKQSSNKETNQRFQTVRSWLKRCCNDKSSDYVASDEEHGLPNDKDRTTDNEISVSWKLQAAKDIGNDEKEFWEVLLKTYLFPFNYNQKEKMEQLNDLLKLRNISVLFIFLTNTFLVVGVFAITSVDAFETSLVLNLECGNEGKNISIEPLSILFTLMFGILLFIQFVCMIYHRFSTLIHVMSEAKYCGIDTLEDDAKTVIFDISYNTNENRPGTAIRQTVFESGTKAVDEIHQRPKTGLKREQTANELVIKRTRAN